MDLEALTLLKLLLVGGLAWLSLRKLKRYETHQQEIHARRNWTLVPENPIVDRGKFKDESCRSTSAASKTDINYEDYCAIYDQLWLEHEDLPLAPTPIHPQPPQPTHPQQSSQPIDVCNAQLNMLAGSV